jgi:hypothetical protein
MEWKDFEKKVYKFFEEKGYLVKLDEKVVGRSGDSYEVDVLAIDRRLEEVKIACQCKAWSKPVDRDAILQWAQVCSDISAVPAFASMSGYTEAALELAKKLGFIILVYDEESREVRKAAARPSPKSSLPEILVTMAESKLKDAEHLIDQYSIRLQHTKLEEESREKGSTESELKEIKNRVKASLSEVITLYEQALKMNPDKYLWLRLGDICLRYAEWLESPNERPEKGSKGKWLEYYTNALKEHLKEFPQLLEKLRSIGINLDDILTKMSASISSEDKSYKIISKEHSSPSDRLEAMILNYIRERGCVGKSELYNWITNIGISPVDYHHALKSLLKEGLITRKFDSDRNELVYCSNVL